MRIRLLVDHDGAQRLPDAQRCLAERWDLVGDVVDAWWPLPPDMAERTAILFDHLEWQLPLGRSRRRCGVTLECWDQFAEDWLLRGMTKSRQRDQSGLQNQPLSSVEYLAGGVEVPCMTGRLFDQVQHDKAKIGNHPVAQARIYLAWRRVERCRTNHLVRGLTIASPLSIVEDRTPSRSS